jgi:hypothetical protein
MLGIIGVVTVLRVTCPLGSKVTGGVEGVTAAGSSVGVTFDFNNGVGELRGASTVGSGGGCNA